MDKIELMFALIRSEICKEALSDDVKKSLTPEVLSLLYKVSKKHDIAQILATALDKHGLLTEQNDIADKFHREEYLAVYRYERINHELERICSTLKNAKIYFIPLKGSVIRKYYPEPWLRTSADIDILIKEDDLDQAINELKAIDYSWDSQKHYHDVSMHSKSGVHLELHFSIKENIEKIDRVLERVWDFAEPQDGCLYSLSNEFMLFYVTAHMSYHFINGGCGIRPLIDLWLLSNNIVYDKTKLSELLTECEIEKFHCHITDLSEVWMSGRSHNEVTQMLQEYVTRGGVYGSAENRITVAQNKNKGKGAHILKRIFMPYNELKILFPILETHSYLTPFAQICRWIRALFKGRLKPSIREFKVNNSISEEQRNKNKELLEKIGLD